MRKLKRDNCAILQLVLTAHWYDMIANGGKRQEYRDITIYWKTRIDRWTENRKRGKTLVVAFSRGYRKADMFFTVEKVPVVTSLGYAPFRQWGEPDTPHFAIYLAERVELEG